MMIMMEDKRQERTSVAFNTNFNCNSKKIVCKNHLKFITITFRVNKKKSPVFI